MTRAEALSVSRCLLLLINAAPLAHGAVRTALHRPIPNPPRSKAEGGRGRLTPGAGGAEPPLIHCAREASQISCGAQIPHGNLSPSTQGVTEVKHARTAVSRGRAGAQSWERARRGSEPAAKVTLPGPEPPALPDAGGNDQGGSSGHPEPLSGS